MSTPHIGLPRWVEPAYGITAGGVVLGLGLIAAGAAAGYGSNVTNAGIVLAALAFVPAVMFGRRVLPEKRTSSQLAQIAIDHPRLTPGTPDPQWLIAYTVVVTAANMLTPAELRDLDELYIADDTPARQQAFTHALRVAHAANGSRYSIVDADEAGDLRLSALASRSRGGACAALAVLVRELIPRGDFQLLTRPWVTAGLPVPHGDTAEWWHIRLEAFHNGGWQLVQAENVPAPHGETPQAHAEGVAAQLSPRQKAHPGTWRVRIWPGMFSRAFAFTHPADGEYLYEVGQLPAEAQA